MFTYQIGDKAYIQKPLVWGQVRQLNEQLKGISINQAMGIPDLISGVGDKLCKILAIVLIEVGDDPVGNGLPAAPGATRCDGAQARRERGEKPFRNGSCGRPFPTPKRDENEIAALADELEYLIEPETIIKVAEDFFVCNPVASILRLNGMLEGISRKMAMPQIGSLKPAPSSREETSPSETKSSGDIPPENPSLSSDIAGEK